jgi:hypothetical protein
VVFGLFVGLGMLMFAALRRMFRPAASPATAPQERIIEGEYAVVGRPQVSVQQH